jgi:hypothetical protein
MNGSQKSNLLRPHQYELYKGNRTDKLTVSFPKSPEFCALPATNFQD